MKLGFFVISVLPALGLFAQTKSDKPNVIIILADDLGWNDLGFMGSEYYETPNIDRLAKMGISYSNNYSACNVSSPSRASLLTGKYPARHGITSWIGDSSGELWRKQNRATKMLPAEYNRGLDDGEVTLAEAFKRNGYSTFIAGKWHIGEGNSIPENNGFDVNVGAWGSGSPRGGYFSPYKNPMLKDGEIGENLSMRLSQETINFIKGQDGNPFFAYLSFYAVHGPIQTTHERWRYFRDKAQRQGVSGCGFEIDRTLPVRKNQDNPVYAGLVAQLDDAVGKLLDELIAMQMDKNTIIIFTSDNGGVVSGDNYSTSLTPLRGGKGRQWEGGIRTPLILYYPDCPKGEICDTPAIGIDIYPTVLDIAQIVTPKEQVLDGVSLVSSDSKLHKRDLYWHYPHYGNQGGEPSSIIRRGDWKLIYYHEDHRCELYNLVDDIGEKNDLVNQHSAIATRMKSGLMKWLAQMGAKFPENDYLYSKEKENERLNSYKTTLINKLENERTEMLNSKWQPNANWWGSAPYVQTAD